MNSTLRLTCVAAAIGLFATTAVAATTPATPSLKGHELAAGAKVSLDQARAIATKARSGTIVDQEIEKEHGGSGLRYSFDVKAGAKTYEVGVDAVTGKVLENGGESAAKEAKEVKTEKAEKPAAKH